MVNIEGLDKAIVLCALFNEAKVQKLGSSLKHMTELTHVMEVPEAKVLLNQDIYFNHVYGKILKINLRSDMEFDECHYDQYNGVGKAHEVIHKCRRGGIING